MGLLWDYVFGPGGGTNTLTNTLANLPNVSQLIKVTKLGGDDLSKTVLITFSLFNIDVLDDMRRMRKGERESESLVELCQLLLQRLID